MFSKQNYYKKLAFLFVDLGFSLRCEFLRLCKNHNQGYVEKLGVSIDKDKEKKGTDKIPVFLPPKANIVKENGKKFLESGNFIIDASNMGNGSYIDFIGAESQKDKKYLLWEAGYDLVLPFLIQNGETKKKELTEKGEKYLYSFLKALVYSRDFLDYADILNEFSKLIKNKELALELEPALLRANQKSLEESFGRGSFIDIYLDEMTSHLPKDEREEEKKALIKEEIWKFHNDKQMDLLFNLFYGLLLSKNWFKYTPIVREFFHWLNPKNKKKLKRALDILEDRLSVLGIA